MATTEVAAVLGRSVRTVQRMAKRGELPYEEKLPGLTAGYLFSRSVVELYLRSSAKPHAEAS